MLKVAELQRFLGNMAPFARAAGASEKVVAEFDRAIECLDPFKEKTLTEFSDFLRKADEFDRTGKLLPPVSTRGKPKTAKAASLTVDEAAEIFQTLHGRATDPALTYADIDLTLAGFAKLTIAQLKEVAAKVNVTLSAKAKKQILEELTRRIKELKASHERTQFRFGETA